MRLFYFAGNVMILKYFGVRSFHVACTTHILGGLAACVFLGLMYAPGLSGPFIFDDYGTLRPLGNWGVIDNFEKLKLYVFSGFTGPGGRPVALLTFALNADTWPASPRPFILTNILIHIANGLLLFFVVRKLLLAQASVPSNRVLMIAGGAAILWLLHPIHTSTVLYIVQRMTLLSATFSLLAIWFYLQARISIFSCKYTVTVMWLFGAAMAAFLAFFSKENSVLLPIQIALVELYLRYSGAKPQDKNRLYQLILVGLTLACAVVLLYLLKQFAQHTINYWTTGVEETYGRTFTLYERLFTQLRVVGDYLLLLAVPKMQSSGVFHDGYAISHSLWQPVSTLLWLIAHSSIIAAAVLCRRRLSWLFFGVLWFYGSHLLESTVVMLELKFEHRNYIPSMGLFFVAAYALSLIANRVKALTLLGLISMVYAVMLYLSASLWGKPLQAAMVWTQANPQSSRALNHVAKIAMETEGGYDLAKEYMKKSIQVGQSRGAEESRVDELKYIMIFCETYNNAPPNWERMAYGVEFGPRDWSLYDVLGEMLNQHIAGKCGMLSFDGYQRLLNAYRNNPVYQNNLSVLKMDEFEIHAALYFGYPDVALAIEENRQELMIPLAFKMKRAQLLATYGYVAEAALKLEIGIEVAKQLGAYDDFTMRSAEEMLALMQADLSDQVREHE